MTGIAEPIRVEVNGLTLNVLDVGTGPGILLLHGFPDSHRLWRNQVPALVDAGFRVIAPDLRGFGDSDKPQEVSAYRMPHVLDDVRGVLRTLGVPRVHVVGHDWGAVVAWMTAITQPHRVDRLVAVSVAHPATAFDPGIEQLRRWWYQWLFQFPGVGEALLPRDGWGFLHEWAAGSADREQYRLDLERPGALTAALNWYRANANPRALLDSPPIFTQIETPVMGIFGANDPYVLEQPMLDSAAQVSGPWRYERFDDAGHWIPIEQPDRLNRLLLEFLAKPPRAPRPEPDIRASLGGRDTSALAERLHERHPEAPPPEAG